MGKIPPTGGGLPEETAVQAGKMLREGWDTLRSLQFNKKASILRYEETAPAKPEIGQAAETALVPGLADLDVYVSRVSTREVTASRGKIELSDMLFVFYEEVRDTDEILYGGKTHKVVQVRFWDPDIGRSVVIGRSV